MKAYFLILQFFGAFKISTWERIFATKMPYLMFLETKMTYFMIFMFFTETLYLSLHKKEPF